MIEKTKRPIPYGIILNDDDRETIDRIKELTGLRNTSDIIRQAIRIYHKDIEPLYVRAKASSPKRAVYESPEDRVKAQIKKKQEDDDAKRAIEKEKALNICTALGGEIIEQENGAVACKFPLYEKVGKRVLEGSRTIPFENLHESVIETQFKGGTKEEILALLNK